MKWAKVTAQTPSLSKGNSCSVLRDRNDRLCFKQYSSLEELEKHLACHENLWAQYEFEYDFSCEERESNARLEKESPEKFERLMEETADKNFRKFQERYESFSGGFLDFYDRIVRRKNTDHTVYFKWSRLGKGKEKNLYGIKIYLSPAPLRYKPHAQSNGTSKLDQYNRSEQNYLTSDTSGDLTTDPPPPPPPPPPTMY